MVVDPIDGERVNVAAGRTKHDQRALVVTDLARKSEHIGQGDFRHTAAAVGGPAAPADFLQAYAAAIGTDDLFDRRARNGEMLAADRYRQRRDDREGQWNAKRHA